MIKGQKCRFLRHKIKIWRVLCRKTGRQGEWESPHDKSRHFTVNIGVFRKVQLSLAPMHKQPCQRKAPRVRLMLLLLKWHITKGTEKPFAYCIISFTNTKTSVKWVLVTMARRVLKNVDGGNGHTMSSVEIVIIQITKTRFVVFIYFSVSVGGSDLCGLSYRISS
jgi:hypothetical protein